jgi:hypothetical protein
MTNNDPDCENEAALALTYEQVEKLASIIVPHAHAEAAYSPDEIALALIRLAAGIAPDGERQDIAFTVTFGCFRHTTAHDKALDVFNKRALSIKPDEIPASSSYKDRIEKEGEFG